MAVSMRKTSRSKNRKKAWRRSSDVADIEEHLENKRRDEISGGPVSEKADNNIFFIEKKPAKEILTKAQRRQKKQNARHHLRCFRGLENDSKVEPPMKPPNANQRFKARTIHPLKLARRMKREQLIAGNRTKMMEELERLREKHLETGTYDLWDPEDAPFDEKPEEVMADGKLDDYYREQIRKKAYKVPFNRCLKPSALSSVEIPHPGASYNPAFDDHQRLIREAVRIEERKIRKANKLKRTLTAFFTKVSQASNQDNWLHEMSQGLIDDGRSDNEGDIDCSAPLSLNPAIRAENRKSAKKRRRQARHEKLLNEVRKRKALAKKENQVSRISALRAEIKQLAKRSEERKQQRRLRRLEKASQPSRLSKYRYEAPDLEVNLSHELKGSFRLLKMEGSLFNDRYKSFQRRNIIETKQNRKIKLKKLKLKRYVRKGFAEADAYFG